MFRTISAISALVVGLSLSASAGVITGVFSDYVAWDDFIETPSPTEAYAGPHAPHTSSGISGTVTLDPSPDTTALPQTFPKPMAADTNSDGNYDLYSGATTATYTFSSPQGTGTGLAEIRTMIVQMKLDNSQSAPGLNVGTLSLSFNGQAVNAAFSSIDTVNYQYAWQFDLTGLDVSESDFSFAITALGNHASLEEARIDFSTTSFTGVNVLPVPEPSAGALALLATTGTLLSLRRRRRK